MELNVHSNKEFSRFLFNILNEQGIYLIDTGYCNLESREPDSLECGDNEKNRIYVEVQQISYSELEEATRIFLDRYSSRNIEIIEDQAGTLFMDNYKVSYDEGEYYYCTCPFHQRTNKVCHHIVAVHIRKKGNTLHLKTIRVNKVMTQLRVTYDVNTGVLTIPENINEWVTDEQSRLVVYDMMKYGLSIGQIRDHYDIQVDTGYEVINRLGKLVDKVEIKIRKKSER